MRVDRRRPRGRAALGLPHHPQSYASGVGFLSLYRNRGLPPECKSSVNPRGDHADVRAGRDTLRAAAVTADANVRITGQGLRAPCGEGRQIMNTRTLASRFVVIVSGITVTASALAQVSPEATYPAAPAATGAYDPAQTPATPAAAPAADAQAPAYQAPAADAQAPVAQPPAYQAPAGDAQPPVAQPPVYQVPAQVPAYPPPAATPGVPMPGAAPYGTAPYG